MNFRVKLLLLGAAATTSLMAFSPDIPDGVGPLRRVASFQRTIAVRDPFLGTGSARNAMVGDYLPWTVREARGSIDSAGGVHASIHGLVLADSPEVPAGLRGKNDQPQFRIVLMCQTTGADGRPVSAQVSSDGFPATETGDCRIDAVLPIPRPCTSPVLFITGVDDRLWLASCSVDSSE